MSQNSCAHLFWNHRVLEIFTCSTCGNVIAVSTATAAIFWGGKQGRKQTW